MRIEDHSGEGRKAPFGVFWNVYREEFAGRPKTKSAWFATLAEAEEFRSRTLAALAEADAASEAAPSSVAIVTNTAAPDPELLRALQAVWLVEHILAERDPATHHGYESNMRLHIVPALGDLKISDRTATPLVVKRFYKGLFDQGMSLGMRRSVHRTLSSFMTFCKTEGLVRENPCEDQGRLLRKKGESDENAEPNPFSAEEVARIFDHIEACEPDWLLYFQLLHDCGPRVGEVAALKWSCLDLAAKTATIMLNYSPAAKGDKDPKTHEKRTIRLTSRVVELLQRWLVEQRRETFRRGIKPPAYVVTNRRGLPRRQDGNMRRVFARIMQACGTVAGPTGQLHTPHDFRDTFATSHLQEDWDRKLAWVSKQLGHKTPQVTIDHYFSYRPTVATKDFADEIRGRK